MSEFSIKKQLNLLYATGILGNLSITGAWVAILSARGFSLLQIGFAETVFHITSLTFEIPSGMLADIYGRKKMLLVSNFMNLVAALVMVASKGLAGVCLSISFYAMGYNFASGSGDALAYDSMKKAGREAGYEKYISNQMVIYRITTGVSTLCAGIALMIGYRWAYLLTAFSALAVLLLTTCLYELETPEMQKHRFAKGEGQKVTAAILQKLVHHFADSIGFLGRNKKATCLMFLNSFVGAVDILLLFFLQSKLRTAGISDGILGVALLVMELGGIVGARLIVKAPRIRYGFLFILCSLGVLSGVWLEHTQVLVWMVAGGFIATMSDDAIQIRTDARLQEMFPSGQRATLISIESFTFSVIMIVLSPVAGWFFERW